MKNFGRRVMVYLIGLILIAIVIWALMVFGNYSITGHF